MVAGANKSIVIPVFQSFITNRYQHHTKCFTDGSKDGPFTGVGVVIGNEEDSHCLPDVCSILSAEAYGLLTAVSNCNDNQDTIILTDSASCLDAIQGGRSKHPWIQAVENISTEQNITFCWIPGHCGINGNERADALAKQARNQPKLDIPIPAQDVIKAIKRNIWSTWENEWRQHQLQLRQIKSLPIKYPDRKCASEQRVLTRLRIGHTRLTHSFIINKKPPPVCNYCGTQLTVQHIFIDCRGYTGQRTSCGINGSLGEILAFDAQREAKALKFIKDCDIYNEI